MSEAGKDADARPKTKAGDSLPSRTLSRVAPQSVQLAKDHALMGRSVWCGVVFALAVVITVVNLLPPSHVGYRVTSQVLVSPQRFQSLERELGKAHVEATEARLLSMKVLDEASGSNARRSADGKESQILIEINSLWSGRTTMGRVHHWLSQVSQVDQRALAKVDSARIQRFARWEVQARENYLKQHRQNQLSKRPSDADQAVDSTASNSSSSLHPNNIKLPVSPDGAKPKFATLGEKKPTMSTASSISRAPVSAGVDREPDEQERQLLQELELARQSEIHASAEIANQAVKAAGVLAISGSPRVRAAPDRTPGTLVLSLFVLGLASGAIGGWANHRAQSGGAFFAADVGVNMQLLGLPILGHIHLPSRDIGGVEGRVTKRITDYRRWAVQQCLALSELVVLFWCMAIVIRMVLDPLWRALLWEYPLSALARLFVGLP